MKDGATEAALAARLRRINLFTGIAATLWVVSTAACTLWMSDRILARSLAEAADNTTRDAKAVSGVVDRMFHELAAIPQVLSANRELRAMVARYNARGEAFSGLPIEQRSRVLKKDPDVARLSERLTVIRNKLNYDLIYALDAHGIRVVSSDWERPLALLGVQLSDREYFKEAMSERAGHMFAVARTTKNPVLFFSAPIEDGEQPIGVVVVRQSSEAVGSLLAGGQHIALIVDDAGMVVATSHPDFALHHVGALAQKRPDAGDLRRIYAQETLRTLDVVPPPHRLHEAHWTINERSYIVTEANLEMEGYSLLVLSPVDWLATVSRLHYVIGALAALFGTLTILFIDRGLCGLARRRHNERVTRALNRKLTSVNAEKDHYLGIVAHDLRNPLSSMRGLAELMLQMPLEPAQQREFLETIHRTSDETLGMVNDLLDVAMIESGKLDLKRSEQDLVKLVRRRLGHLEPHARNKKMELRLEAEGVQHASIDPARFGQVIDNLVSNAIKFSPPQTTVEIALRSAGGNFTFSVQDEGPGIPEAERELLFRSFQKLSTRPTGGEKSTGLGLAIAKRIVDAHGGRIDVESGPSGGTRFTVTAPTAPIQENPP